MRRINWNKKMIIGVVLLIIGLLLTLVFQKTEIGLKVFLPMHIPVLLGGLLLPPGLALAVGILIPLLSSILIGAPVLMPIGIIMIFELGICGLLISLLNRKLGFPILFALILSIIGGKIASGIVVWIMVDLLGVYMLHSIPYIQEGVRIGIPGLIGQLIIVPGLMYMINKWTTINIDW